jgi:hypothetical protein
MENIPMLVTARSQRMSGVRLRCAAALWVVAAWQCFPDAGANDLRVEAVVPFAPYAHRRWAWAAQYTGYWRWPCYPFASCATMLEYRLLDRRMQRFEQLRREPPAPAPPPALPFGPPGPENELQPEYRDSGKIRPELEASGQFRPEFLEGRARNRTGVR